jgi:hypothetical protein
MHIKTPKDVLAVKGDLVGLEAALVKYEKSVRTSVKNGSNTSVYLQQVVLRIREIIKVTQAKQRIQKVVETMDMSLINGLHKTCQGCLGNVQPMKQAYIIYSKIAKAELNIYLAKCDYIKSQASSAYPTAENPMRTYKYLVPTEVQLEHWRWMREDLM